MILSVDSDAGIIKIGSPPEELTGIVESISINNKLLMENAELQGRSGKVKIVQGWDDTALSISLLLIDNPETGVTRWDSLTTITNVFRKVAANGRPEIYSLSHPMIDAWGSNALLFSRLESKEFRKRQKITVSLEFVEHDSAAGIIQQRQHTADTAAAETPAAPVEPVISDRQRRGLGSMEERFGNL